MRQHDENHQSLMHDARTQLARRNVEVQHTINELQASLSKLSYMQLARQLRSVVRAAIPAEARMLVISKGDPQLLQHDQHRAAHFPQATDGQYAGHHPATSREAIAHLEELRQKSGAQYLLIPATASWWLEHYREFSGHMASKYQEVWKDESCIIFRLSDKEPDEQGLRELQKNWHDFGRRDPLWAILTYPDKRNHKWSLDEFFHTGEWEIRNLIEFAASLDVKFSRRHALDFGCGVGRLTQALGEHFEQCDGVDIAPSMIELATKYNRHGARCRYHLNATNDLKLFSDASFDFIYSNIVLQHMKPEYVKNYIREFIRVLVPGGLLVFQLPTGPADVVMQKKQMASHAGDILPDAAFKARISTRKKSMSVKAASQTVVRVRVKNISALEWPAESAMSETYGIWLGNHWLDESGNILVNDDGKTKLPQGLKPDEEVELELMANTPTVPGRYLLELDLVQENVAWFKSKGSESALIQVKVGGTRRERTTRQTDADENLIVPVMEMHGVSRELALEWIIEAGGVVVCVRENDYVPEWNSLEYYVTK
ncbi:MAG TPA: methyltransferase domain-containing protein [Pyrinomonadaceae bacterium]|jgi:ubiquinone/menaquinone biosynthesis C-methylase UbiE